MYDFFDWFFDPLSTLSATVCPPIRNLFDPPPSVRTSCIEAPCALQHGERGRWEDDFKQFVTEDGCREERKARREHRRRHLLQIASKYTRRRRRQSAATHAHWEARIARANRLHAVQRPSLLTRLEWRVWTCGLDVCRHFNGVQACKVEISLWDQRYSCLKSRNDQERNHFRRKWQPLS